MAQVITYSMLLDLELYNCYGQQPGTIHERSKLLETSSGRKDFNLFTLALKIDNPDEIKQNNMTLLYRVTKHSTALEIPP